MPNLPVPEQALAAPATGAAADKPLTLPEPGSVSVHKNGTLYTVLSVTTAPDDEKSDEFPVTVLYMGPDGRKWSRTLKRWHGSMTQVASAEFTPGTLMSYIHIALLQWDCVRKARRAQR
jgi:hypothetical protein